MHNKAVYIVPMNPLNVVGDANTAKNVANIHIDW